MSKDVGPLWRVQCRCLMGGSRWLHSAGRLFVTLSVAASLFTLSPKPAAESARELFWHLLCIWQREVLSMGSPQPSQLAGQSSSLGWLPGLSYLWRFFSLRTGLKGYRSRESGIFLVWLFTRGGCGTLGSLSWFHVNNSVVCVDVPPGCCRYALGTA